MATPSRDPFYSTSPTSQTPQMSSSRSSLDSSRSPRPSVANMQLQNPSNAAQHRQSFSDSRYPPSPRSTRQSSISSMAVQELIDNPPHRIPADARFANRDWKTIRLGELTTPEDLKFVDIDASVEDATNVSSTYRDLLSMLIEAATHRLRRSRPADSGFDLSCPRGRYF